MDLDRIEQFKNTKLIYDAMPEIKEFIIPTRSLEKLEPQLKKLGLFKDTRLIPYTIVKGFNVSKALNIGVRESKYDQIIITSPEVKPQPDLLTQLKKSIGQNIICSAVDEDSEGKLSPLVHNGFRSENPAMYFLALFNKKDIEAINGWDEAFMDGYAYEDNDFGERWNRAGLPFVVRDDLNGVHQYHPRSETIVNGFMTNLDLFNKNNADGIIKPVKGLML